MRAIPLLCTCLLLLTATATHAQIETGAKLGVNLNQFNQPGTVFGFNGGVFGRYTLTPFAKARVELLYMQQGGARQNYYRDYSYMDGNVQGINYTNRFVTFHNLEIPVLAELTLPELADGAIVPRLLVGGAYGITLGAFETHEKTYYFDDDVTPRVMVSDKRENVGSNYKRNQFGLIAGMAIDFKVGERTFTTEIRYRRNLNQLNLIRFGTPDLNGLPGTIGQEGDLYTSTLSINFGMTIFNF